MALQHLAPPPISAPRPWSTVEGSDRRPPWPPDPSATPGLPGRGPGASDSTQGGDPPDTKGPCLASSSMARICSSSPELQPGIRDTLWTAAVIRPVLCPHAIYAGAARVTLVTAAVLPGASGCGSPGGLPSLSAWPPAPAPAPSSPPSWRATVRRCCCTGPGPPARPTHCWGPTGGQPAGCLVSGPTTPGAAPP